jgi:hypothetical protein
MQHHEGHEAREGRNRSAEKLPGFLRGRGQSGVSFADDVNNGAAMTHRGNEAPGYPQSAKG